MRAVCGALYHKRMDYICTHCGARREINGAPPRCECGGLWKLATPALAFSSALCDDAAQGVFRYRAFMPLSGEGWRRVTMGEGNTPLVRLDDDVTLKFDALMPTLSYKDRGAAVLAAHMSDMGVTRAVQDSSGNAGNSVAAYCARAGIECEIYVPEGASPGTARSGPKKRARMPGFSLREGGEIAAPSNAGAAGTDESDPVALRRRSISARCSAL